jgi:hypothetical protein
MRTKVQQPDHRNNGQFQFVTGYTGGFGAEACVHLTLEEYKERIQAKLGPGTLIEEKGIFYWETPGVPEWSNSLFDFLKRIKAATHTGSWNEVNWACRDIETRIKELTGE